ncbi:TonB-dependent receptor [Wenyingzhuangia aestuarii]|uniref:TonB-dependent receptor n=1 Tax=Wenyingzhuangia aestuarii TaxID=1647582 RepID=UPI001439C013|nr:TonB-dependent receptor [Wenyingzhuangia aestuarii]NJB81247.1 hypothetical protein [Wenyingzhuangia aestuarii]
MNKLFWFFYLVTAIVFSQEKTSLKKVLNTLSNKYQIAFSYDENQIQKFTSILVDESEILEYQLVSISNQTQLIFEKIDAKNYILRLPTSSKTSVCGTIVSAKNNQKLSFVTVSCNGKTVYTNSQGYFELKDVLSDGFITISSLEYQSKTVAIASFGKDCIAISLNDEVNYLNEIVITDYLTRGFSKKKDGSIVLDPKKLGILPGVIEPDVLQTLQLIPGVQSPDETASGIHIRGSTPDQNLVVFDGMKMYHFSHFFGLISAFNPYITNNVKLYRSGTHAKYGNNVGGVLDISIDTTVPKKTNIGFGSTFTHADFYIKTPLFTNKVGLVFSARRSITDLVNSITFQKYSEVVFQNSRISDGLEDNNLKVINAKNDFYYEDYHTKIIVQPNAKNKLSFSYLYNVNDLNFTGTTTLIREGFQDDIRVKNTGFRADWKYGLSKNGSHQIAYSSTNFNKNYQGSRTTTLRNGNEEVASFGKDNQVIENSLEYIFEKETKKHNKWQLGYQFSNYNVGYNFYRNTPDITNGINDIIQGQTKNYALFTEYQFRNSKQWLVNLGLRFQSFDKIDDHYLEPRLNINYKVNKALSFKFSTELKHQSMSQVVDFRSDGLGGLFDRFWALSDGGEFPVLQSIQTSIGTDYQKNNWTIDLDFYKKKVNGVLLLIDENIKSRKYFSGSNTVLGMDVLVKRTWNNYNTWVSYSLSKSQYLFNKLNNSKKFDGSYDAPHNLIWSHNYSYKQLEFSLGWRFRSGIPYTIKTAVEKNNQEGLRVDFENLNTERLPNYQRLDFSTSYKFYVNRTPKIKGVFGITFQNLINKKNILNRDYEIETVIIGKGSSREEKEVLVETDRLSMGFVPNAVFRINF